MTERLYYNDSFLRRFSAAVREVISANGRPAVVLDRTAFYPTSGGQPHDTGRLRVNGSELPVIDVIDREADGAIVHVLGGDNGLKQGSSVEGEIDVQRRRDHMQQHSGQHVLSAAFIRLFESPTVSFHLGEQICAIDLDTSSLTREQVIQAEELANTVVTEDREVTIRYAGPEEAQSMGLRKLPPREGKIRIIDIRDFDLTACGGTHVARTGQIGPILLRRFEKTRQGIRVEFICGQRAIRTSRADYETLAEAAALYSAHPRELPEMIRRSIDESKAASKSAQKLLGQLAEYEAAALLQEAEQKTSCLLVEKVYADRDAAYLKLLAQALITTPALVALLASTAGAPVVILACTHDLPFDCGAILKAALAATGGRGGGSRDLAQGGVRDAAKLPSILAAIEARL